MIRTSCKVPEAFLAATILLTLSCVPSWAQHKLAPTTYPYSAVVRIHIEWPNKTTGTASGVIVDRFHVLTCAHALCQSSMGGFPKSLKVIPMQNGNELPFGFAMATKRRIYKEFVEYDRLNPGKTSDEAKDIALLTLDRTIGDQAGSMSFGSAAADAFAGGTSFDVVGYPGQDGYDGRKMYMCAGPVAGLSNNGGCVLYKKGGQILSIPGMSGGPVWKIDARTKKPMVYAINVGAPNDTNDGFATRITKKIFDDLQTWRLSDSVPGRLPAKTALLDFQPAGRHFPQFRALPLEFETSSDGRNS